MHTRSYYCHVFVIVLLLLLPGCKHKFSTGGRALYTEKRNTLELRVERLSSVDTHKQFGRNLMKYGYQPIKITIINDGDDLLFLRAASIDLSLVAAHEVCRATAVPVLGVLCVPAYLSALFAWPALIPIIGLGAWLTARNQHVKGKIRERLLAADKAVEILPFERIERTIFVPTGTCIDQFTLHLFNVHEKTFEPFTINLT